MADSNRTDLELGKGNDYLVQGNTIQIKAMDFNFLKIGTSTLGLETSPKKFPIKLVNTHNIQINKLFLNSIIHLSHTLFKPNVNKLKNK